MSKRSRGNGNEATHSPKRAHGGEAASPTVTGEGPRDVFLNHMFLDDVRDVGGHGPLSAIDSFDACLAHTHLHESTRMALRVGGDLHPGRMLILPLGYYDMHKKMGHASAVLLFMRQSDSVVAVADTGETAVVYPRSRNEHAIVIVGTTTHAGAQRVQTLVRSYASNLRSGEDLIKARRAIMGVCNVSMDRLDGGRVGARWDYIDHGASDPKWTEMSDTESANIENNYKKFMKVQQENRAFFTTERDAGGWQYDFSRMIRRRDYNTDQDIRRSCRVETATQSDRYLAVRKLTTAGHVLVSHTQRGPTCTFYCVLWLLGLCEALAADERALDQVLLPQGGDCKARFILGSICRVDRALKQAAFAMLVGSVALYTRTADLIAREYSKCTWVDAAELDRALSALEMATPVGVDEASVHFTRVVTAPILETGEPARRLSDIRAWITNYGYIFASIDEYKYRADIEIHASVIAAFTHVARDVLVLPIRDGPHGLEDDTAEGDVLRVADFIMHLLEQLMRCGVGMPLSGFPISSGFVGYYRDTLIGMLMRLCRYAAAIARKEEGDAMDTIEGAPTPVPREFTTRLPWAAAEYYDLIKDTRGLTHLLFDPSNFESLRASLQRSGVALQRKTGPQIMPVQTYHEQTKMALIKQLETLKKQGQSTDNTLILRITELNRIELTEPQLEAIRYINSKAHLVDLNVAIAHLNVAIQYPESRYGLRKYRSKGGPVYYAIGFRDRSLVFHVSPTKTYNDAYMDDRDMYRATRDMSLRILHTERVDPYARERPELFQNAEYVYWYTRACARKPAGTEPPYSSLNVVAWYPVPGIQHDIDELVKWADYIGSVERKHEGHSLFALVHMYVTHIAAEGATRDHAVALIGQLHARLTALKREDGAEDEARLIRIIIGARGDEEDAKTEVKDDRLRGALYARAALACATGRLGGTIGGASHATTDPPTPWAITDISGSNGQHTNEAGDAFVVSVKGDGPMRKIRERLEWAGCRFDHWLTPASSYRIEAGGATMRIEAQLVHVKVGTDQYELHQGLCEWWDMTHGAAVFPVFRAPVQPGMLEKADSHPTGLLVIPGEWTVHQARTEFAALSPLDYKAAAYIKGYLDGILTAKGAFVVSLDATGKMPAHATAAEEVVCVFAAYAFAGSVVGTRLMPAVASHAIYDDAIRRMVEGAPCPLARYSAQALLYRADPSGSELRCEPSDVFRELSARVRPHASHRRSYWVEYNEDVWQRALLRAEANGGRHAPVPRVVAQSHDALDSWKTAFEASTEKFVSAEQSTKIESIMREPWVVVQMGMGFGKSSVIVPMLVARFLSIDDVRVVFVTQPHHLVAQAARNVAALIAAHPYTSDGSLAFSMSRADFEKATARLGGAGNVGQLKCKLVVVLSTSDMQRVVRDDCTIYAASEHIAHISDEVDTESDSLRSEVIIEGEDRKFHYQPGISPRDYCDLAFLLACDSQNTTEIGRLVSTLDKAGEAGEGGAAHGEAELREQSEAVKAGTRLRSVFSEVEAKMVYRINYGMSNDPRKLIAVPYIYAGSPSEYLEFSDKDVATAATALSVRSAARHTYADAIRTFVRAKFRQHADVILQALEGDPIAEKRLYLTLMALPRIMTSATETVVSFVDLIGAARFLVGFSGTMGTRLVAPEYSGGTDPRWWRRGRPIPVKDDAAENDAVERLIRAAHCISVRGEPSGTRRASRALDAIRSYIAGTKPKFVCIIDGCGELGSFDDELAVLSQKFGEIGHFNDKGVLVNAKDTSYRYYRHRDSRGVDSDMPVGTVGFVLADHDPGRSDRASIAQAMLRMRQLRSGEHTAVFVALSKGEGVDIKGDHLYGALSYNETAAALAGTSLMARQRARAARPKLTQADFVYPVVYRSVSGDETMRLASKQAMSLAMAHSEALVQKQTASSQGYACYLHDDNIRSSTRKFTFLNETTISKIAGSLKETGIALSFLLTTAKTGNGTRRAFAVSKQHGTIVVASIVEVWAGYRHDQPNRASSYTYYAHDGRVIWPVGMDPTGVDSQIVLLGRFLCDDPLGIDEEMSLLLYLQKRYETEKQRDHLTKVLDCLLRSRFISSPTVLLKLLTVKSGARNLDDLVSMHSSEISSLMFSYPFMQQTVAKIIDDARARNGATQMQSFGRRCTRLYV